MGGGGITPRQEGVQPLLGLRNALRNSIAQAPQSRRTDRDEERRNGLPALTEVVEAGRDQVAAGKASDFHR